jgi:hypothetical protein
VSHERLAPRSGDACKGHGRSATIAVRGVAGATIPSSDSKAVELRIRVGLAAARQIGVLSPLFVGPASPKNAAFPPAIAFPPAMLLMSRSLHYH